MSAKRVVLVDPDAETREVFAQRLRAQGFVVEEAADGVQGAEMALAAPPAAVIADLWMPGVSGVQLSRLLRAEPATADVPVVLRAESDDARSRFWARRAGAERLVMKGRMGELVRALGDVTAEPPADDAFFFRVSESTDVRDRIAQHLDRALFESVVSAEVRALASANTFDRLFDSLSQLVAQLIDYRWLALSTSTPQHFAVHAHRKQAQSAEQEARATIVGVPETTKTTKILDDDALDVSDSERTCVFDISWGSTPLGQLAFGIPAGATHVDAIAPLVARELGAVIRVVLLFEQSQLLATTDGLTSLYNRRAFIESVTETLQRADATGAPFSFLVLDLDHFKVINDTHGHGAGDLVLASVARALRDQLRSSDLIGRWGGEEFVVALPYTREADAGILAERLRAMVAKLAVVNAKGVQIPLSVSIGVAEHKNGQSLDTLVDQADRAMYTAKVNGRDRVHVASADAPTRPSLRAA